MVAALVGTVEHARRQQAAGVDLIVAQGYEAGGHTGEWPPWCWSPVVDAVAPVPVLAAGGIAAAARSPPPGARRRRGCGAVRRG